MPLTFSDPIHGTVEVPDSLRAVIESPVLARLRNIKQLGFTPTVFTGAVHTRFEHTIGTYAALAKLLDLFRVTDKAERETYLSNALLSEIGCYPLSYSTRSVFTRFVGLTKDEYRRLLHATFLSRDIRMHEIDGRLLGAKPLEQAWGESPDAVRMFVKDCLLTIASNVDYVLRDSYYSGRHSDLFDFRYFLTSRGIDTDDGVKEVQEGLRELHRAVHALNAVYGHRVRRFVTLIFLRLIVRLEARYLALKKLRDAQAYVSTDDDKFLALLGEGVAAAQRDGDSVAKKMMNAVSQITSFEVQRLPLGGEFKGKKLDEIEEQIATQRGINRALVFCISDYLDNELGFVIFGKHFPSYKKAISSKFFRTATGLAHGGDRTTLYDSGHFYCVVL